MKAVQWNLICQFKGVTAKESCMPHHKDWLKTQKEIWSNHLEIVKMKKKVWKIIMLINSEMANQILLN